MKSLLPVVFALMTGLFWGVYGPVLGEARAFDKSPFKPYVMIGVAYLIWGIIGGLVGMKIKGDSFDFSTQGMTWGFAAGSLGAFGALSLTLAMYSGGTAMPQIVMPIVFGTAVTVAAIAAMVTTKAVVNPMLYVGIVGMFISIVIVAAYTPSAHPPSPGGKPAPHAAETPKS
jgi:hypothetical protein